MAAGKYNIVVQQGADFSQTITLKDSLGVPINLTGATMRGQIRHKVTDTTPLASFTVVATDLVNGKFTVNIPAATTTTMSFVDGVYDIEIQYPNGTIDRILQGRAIFSPEVTR